MQILKALNKLKINKQTYYLTHAILDNNAALLLDKNAYLKGKCEHVTVKI